MSVGRICVRDIDVTTVDESVQVAASRMQSRAVGCLIVQNEKLQPIGILTDRDLTVRVVAKGLDSMTTTVCEVMSKAPDSVLEETPVETALSHMRAGRFRRLPVIDLDGKLVGLISLDDILDLLTEEFNEIGQLLKREGPASLAEI